MQARPGARWPPPPPPQPGAPLPLPLPHPALPARPRPAGERIQVHRCEDGACKYFSRKAIEHGEHTNYKWARGGLGRGRREPVGHS